MQRRSKFAAASAVLLLCGIVVAQIAKRIAHLYTHQLKLEISTRKELFFVMEPIFLDVKITNISDQPIKDFFQRQSAFNPYIIVAKNINGIVLPATRFGKAEQERAEKRKITSYGGAMERDLEPHETITARVCLNKYVDMTESIESGDGYYKVQLQRFGVSSNAIHVGLLSRDFNIYDKQILEEALSDMHKRKAREQQETDNRYLTD